MGLSPEARRLLADTRGQDDPTPVERARLRARLDASWRSASGAGARIPRITYKATLGTFSALAMVSVGAWQLARHDYHASSRRATPASVLTQPGASAATAGAAAAAPELAVSAAESRVSDVDSSVPAVRAGRAVAQREPRGHVGVSASARASRTIGANRAARMPDAIEMPRTIELPAVEPISASDRAPGGASSAEPAVRPAQAREPSARSPRSVSTAQRQTPSEDPQLPAAEPGASAPEPTTPATTDPHVPHDAIAAELELLGPAQRALQAGQPSRALQLVQEHAFRHPRGALLQERLVVHALALCALSRKTAAREVIARLAREPGSAPALARVRAACHGDE